MFLRDKLPLLHEVKGKSHNLRNFCVNLYTCRRRRHELTNCVQNHFLFLQFFASLDYVNRGLQFHEVSTLQEVYFLTYDNYTLQF